MCGRFALDLPMHELAALFAVSGPLPNHAPSYNVAPSQGVPVVRRHPDTGERRIDLLRWGLIPHWSRDRGRQPINARSETAAGSALFRGALAARRCIVPARAFYEWRQRPAPKQPFAFGRSDAAPVMLAGIWETWRDPDGTLTRSFAILTTAANAVLRPVHDRMPVVLERPDWAAWLEDGPGGLMRPAPDDALVGWPVSARVNAPRHDDPGLLDPVPGTAARDGAEAGPDSA